MPNGRAIHEDILHKGQQSKEFDDIPPLIKLDYTYQHPFGVMTQAYLKKYIWEFRT